MKATGNQSFTARIGTESSGSAGAWPADEGNILTVNYYDSYEFLGGYSYLSPGAPFTAQPTTRTHGLRTGKKVKNLETGEFYTTAIFYDEKARIIQTLSQHQLGGTVRNFTAYNFEDRPTHSLSSRTPPSVPDILRAYSYNVAGQLASVTHKTGSQNPTTLASYTYNDLGQLTAKSFPNVTSGNQTCAYNIRGWLNSLGSAHTDVFKQTLYYQSGAAVNRWNGNISRTDWSGMTGSGKTRTYNYAYDNANRLTAANYTASGENNWFTVNGMNYDANGNLTHMRRRNQRTPTTYGEVDSLTYFYQTNSNRLSQVRDSHRSVTYSSGDFKDRSATAYSYDLNGNLSGNPDKQIRSINYNHLNLPREVVFISGAKLAYAHDAEGNKLTQKVYNSSGTLTKTRDYIGEAVYLDGSLDYLIHEEGRVAYEDNNYKYEYHVKDHLGNVRQVLRNPTARVFTATMETENATEEEAAFSQLSASRQAGPEHNVTKGGSQVAWLNADRGRVAGPGRTQPIFAGDSVTLRVHGKYADQNITKINAGSYLTQSAKDRMVEGLGELAGSLQRSGAGNPIALLNLADILAGDFKNKKAPEAYLIYALYDTDSNRYEVGKQVLTKNAANRHEILEENLYISEDGYLETFVVNETPEDVWIDDFTVKSSTSPIVQETHYDPWGLELTGIGFQYAGIKANKYLYNGKELIEDNGLQYYDYGARMYDPVIGRWGVVDPLADLAPEWTPYRIAFNNPLTYIDPTGLFETRAEAKEYRKEHGISGRIQKGSDGIFAINDRKNNSSYFKDSSLDGFDNLIGRGEDGVIQSVLVTQEEDNSTLGLGMILDGSGGFGQGMVQAEGSFRLTNGSYNGNQLSPKHYQSGWSGGSRAQITTYNMSRVGSNIGRGSIYGTLVLGAYKINEANVQDGRAFRYNTQVATAQTAGGIVGGSVGAKGGAAAGAAIGVWFWGGGAVPGAIIGGILGGVSGGYIGSEAAGAAVNEIHYRK